MKHTLIEIKNNSQGNNRRVDKVDNQINDLEHKESKNLQSEQQMEKKNPRKTEDSLSSLWDNFKHINIHIMVQGVLEGEEKEQEIRNLSEKIVKENFHNLVKEIDMQV